MRIVIIGGVAGGMSAATRLRRLSEETEIIVLEKGPYVSFANCGLPYHLSGEIAAREELMVQTPEQLRTRFRIDVRPESEVTKIDPVQKEIHYQYQEETRTLTYDKLLLATGAKAIQPTIPGLREAANIYTLRSIKDMDRILLKMTTSQQALVVGGGFIGLEAAENLRKAGKDVTLVEAGPHVLPNLDVEMARFVEEEMRKHGIKVLLNRAVTEFETNRAILSDGESIPFDLTVFSIGVQPDTQLAAAAGLQLGLRNSIKVDEFYQTSQADIHAVGDAISVTNQINGAESLISLASPANRQGRQVADVMMGLPRKNRGSIGTSIVRVFDLAAGSTGLNERQLQQAGQRYQAIHITGKHHAGYFPGAQPLTLKLLFDPENGAIFGAQAVGNSGVDKRIDILATAIKGHLTVEDLPELELSYAPPFGSAKDPVNMAGYAALNLMEGFSESLTPLALKEAQAAGALLIDVRNPLEIAEAGAIPEAKNIPLDQLRDHLSELPLDQPLIVSCHSGQRSYLAERILRNHGFSHVKNLDGAFILYQILFPNEVLK